MPVSMDGIYDRRSWDPDGPPNWSYTGPFTSFQEQQVQKALSSVYMTHDEISQYVVPPLPQVQVFRARKGYPTVQERQARVQDIVNQPRALTSNASMFSGGPAGMSGGSRNFSNTLGMV